MAPDFQVDGSPYETPLPAADEDYAQTPPNFGDRLSALFHTFSNQTGTEAGAEFSGQGAYRSDFWLGTLPRAIANLGAADAGAPPVFDPDLSPIPAPIEDANSINERGPIGPDGKRVHITDTPLSTPVANMVIQAKAAQIQRDGVIARFKNSSSWPVFYGTEMAAFMLDPINAATAFIPGFGEEAVAARLGGGILGRTAGRAVAGATGGAAMQAPLIALRYGLGQEEANDYGLRDAFRDTLFGAAGNAAFHVATGAIGDVIGRRVAASTEGTPASTEAAPASSIDNLDAATKYDAIRTGIAQLTEGRPVDVLPVINMHDLQLVTEAAQLRERDAALASMSVEVHPKAQESADTLASLGEINRQIGSPDITTEERAALSNRRDELLTNTNPETLQEQAASGEIARQVAAQRQNIADRLKQIEGLQTQAAADVALSPLPKLANGQAELYRSGFSSGIADNDFKALDNAIYAPRETVAAPTEMRAGAEPAAPKEAAPAHELSDEERSYLSQEELDEVDASENALSAANERASAYEEAGNCLRAAV
jgi:hypothetical protein